MSLIFANMFGWCVANWRTALVMLGFTLVLLWVSVHYFCGESRREKRIDERAGALIGANVAVNAAIANVETANKIEQQADAHANKARNAVQKNVNLDTANKNRCAVYPDSQECKQ